MDALLFALGLEVVLLQMRLVEGVAELSMRGKKPVSMPEKLQREKLARDRNDSDLDTLDTRRLMKRGNIIGMVDMVKSIVKDILIELVETGECQYLLTAIDLMEKEKDLVVYKQMENDKLILSREAMADELNVKRAMWSVQISKADEKIVFLRDKIRDDLKNNAARLNYADKWLCARAESLELACQTQPVKLPSVDHEQRVHDELARAFELQIKKLEESLDYWHSRYFDDTADINKRVSERRDTMLAAVARRQELQKIYDLHEGEMRAWLTFKRERAARLAREEKLRKSANNIQAWWRGVMVRRGIGAFKHLRNAKKSPTKSKKK